MNYLQYFLSLWPSTDKPTLLWGADRGVLWRNNYEPCHDHLKGLAAIASQWKGIQIWEQYLHKLKTYDQGNNS
jgi:hypothetical protein